MTQLIEALATITGRSLESIKQELETEMYGDTKKKLENLIGEALIIDTDDEGNWSVNDSSIRNAVDDIFTHFYIEERN